MTIVPIEKIETARGKHFVTAIDAAEFCGVTKSYVYRLVREGRLESATTRRAGFPLLIPVRAVRALRRANCPDGVGRPRSGACEPVTA